MVANNSLLTPDTSIDREARTDIALNFSNSTGTSPATLSANLSFPTFNLHGLRIQAIKANDLLAIISEAVETEAKYIVANHNMHGLYLWYQDAQMRELHARADFVHLDGLPLIPLFQLFGLPLNRKHRTAYIEFLPLLAAEAAKKGWRIYYLGSKPGVVERGAAIVRAQHPGLQLRTHHGFFDTHGTANDEVLQDIRSYAPHVLLVGMGMPRQEAWINENWKQILARTIFCSGCTMDYIAGIIPSCPRWLGNSGFEWLYRLFAEPGRLWRRYLVEPWFVLGHLLSGRFSRGRTIGSPRGGLDG
jgi:N-acetylglucosaminyldiphosphoundecaprenol N-acetyl-beta-D-mannosaminyltransferase